MCLENLKILLNIRTSELPKKWYLEENLFSNKFKVRLKHLT